MGGRVPEGPQPPAWLTAIETGGAPGWIDPKLTYATRCDEAVKDRIEKDELPVGTVVAAWWLGNFPVRFVETDIGIFEIPRRSSRSGRAA